MLQAKVENQCRQGKHLKGYFMCCGPVASGRHCLVSTEAAVHKKFQEWQAAGFFEKIWSKGLKQYDELEGIGWEWQSLDGCMVKAPLALESAWKNPIGRGKNWDKTQCSNG